MLQAGVRRCTRNATTWLATAESLADHLSAQLDTHSSTSNTTLQAFQSPSHNYSTLISNRIDSLPHTFAASTLPSTRCAAALPSLTTFTATSARWVGTNTNTSANERKEDTVPTWVDRLSPSIRPYALLSRLDKPIGTWLLLWPSYWSICLAAPPSGPLDVSLLALFGAGAVLLRGAGCTINDLWDRDLDKKVARTRTRPIAAGTITPLQATGWLGLQLTAGLGILLQLNTYSQLLGASSLAFVGTYPLMKRITGWPQAFLGLTMNWGAMLGWAAARGSCDWSAVLPLYCGGIAWTLVYDTIYAHQDKADDVAAGIRSTALTFGKHNKQYLSGFAAANIVCVAMAGQAVNCGLPFYAGLAAAGAHLAWQIATVDLDNGKDCAAKFKSNWWYGMLLCTGIIVDKLL